MDNVRRMFTGLERSLVRLFGVLKRRRRMLCGRYFVECSASVIEGWDVLVRCSVVRRASGGGSVAAVEFEVSVSYGFRFVRVYGRVSEDVCDVDMVADAITAGMRRAMTLLGESARERFTTMLKRYLATPCSIVQGESDTKHYIKPPIIGASVQTENGEEITVGATVKLDGPKMLQFVKRTVLLPAQLADANPDPRCVREAVNILYQGLIGEYRWAEANPTPSTI